MTLFAKQYRKKLFRELMLYRVHLETQRDFSETKEDIQFLSGKCEAIDDVIETLNTKI